MRITPISMAYTRHNSRPQNLRLQNQNVSFEGFFDKFKKEKKQEDKPLTEEELQKMLGLGEYAEPEISREEISKIRKEYAKKVESGEIVPNRDRRDNSDNDTEGQFDWLEDQIRRGNW